MAAPTVSAATGSRDAFTGLGFGQVVRIGAALATAGAGILHLDAAGDHTDHGHIAAFFVAVGVGQLAWAASIARRDVNRRTLALGLVLNAAVLLVWGVSRTVGLPDLIPDAGGIEEIGWKDAAAAGLELAALAAGGFALVMPTAAIAAMLAPRQSERVVRAMAAAALVITVPGVLVSHEHGDHGHAGAEHVEAADHPHTGAELAVATDHAHADGAASPAGAAGEAAAHAHPAAAGTTVAVDHGHPAAATGSGDEPDHVHAEVVDGHGHGSSTEPSAVDHSAPDHAHDPSHHDPALGPAAVDPLAGPGSISTLRVGPLPLLPQIPGVDVPHMTPALPFAGPGRLNVLPLVGLPPPCTDCYVLGIEADLVYADGTSANLDTGPMLHHVVFSDLGRTDPICGRDTLIGQIGHRLFAAGNERTGMRTPEGFGMPLGQSLWGGVVELMNMSTELRVVFIEATVRWVPLSTPDIRPVTSLWLDIDSCGDSEFDVPSGVSDTTWDWTSTVTGRILAAGGHVHDGGEWLGLRNESTGEHVCTSVAGYGTKPAYLGTIESMSTCTWDRLGTVRAGEVLRLNAHYNTSAPTAAVMGIMVVFVHETDDLVAGAASPYPTTPPPDGAPADGAHQH